MFGHATKVAQAVARTSAILIAALIFQAATLAAANEPLNLYVSPDGSDLFTGTQARNNLLKQDGPFQTIAHARDWIRGLRRAQGGKLHRPINVYLRGGTYFLSQPFTLAPEDSGTAECPITYAAYRGETPILSAGRPVRGWGKTTVNGRQVWAAKIPELRTQPERFHEFWVDGHRRTLARLPKAGFFRVESVPDGNDKTPQEQGQKRIRFHQGDLKELKEVGEADVVLMSLWAESHLPVASVEANENLLNFTVPSVFGIAPDDRYFVEGSLDLLQEPGEWCFEHRTGTLYYIPQKGDALVTGSVVIPWHQQVLILNGDPPRGRFVEHVTFRGITFANSEWCLPVHLNPVDDPRHAAGFSQAAVGVPGAVWAQGARNCLFEGCTVAHAGNYGIELGAGCQNDKISYCTMTDLGAGGIKLGEPRIRRAEAEQAGSNEVSDCTIADCGKLFPSAVGLWVGQSGGNRIVHNDIHGLWYSGLSIGWTWGYGDSLTRDNLVEWNHVHHIGMPADGVEPILSDMGAIYTLGVSPGTVIRNNLFHDIAGLRYGGWGIYFDEGTSKVLAENNLVYRTTHGGFHQHYGADNILRNNIFAFGRDAQIQRTRVEDHLSFTFERNIVYWNSGKLLAGNWGRIQALFDQNTYWREGGEPINFAGKTWDQWRAAGMDAHSQVADPGFVDPEHNRFQLKAGHDEGPSGFKPFDLSAAGPRPRPPTSAMMSGG